MASQIAIWQGSLYYTVCSVPCPAHSAPRLARLPLVPQTLHPKTGSCRLGSRIMPTWLQDHAEVAAGSRGVVDGQTAQQISRCSRFSETVI